MPAKRRGLRQARTQRIAPNRARSAILWSTTESTPLGVQLSPANRHDSRMLAPTLDAVPGVRHGRGRPRKRPDKLHANKAYDHHRCRSECWKRRITPCIARRHVDSSERLGRHRWVVERTLAWLNRFRRLTIRYERRADIHEASVLLGCALICLNQIRRYPSWSRGGLCPFLVVPIRALARSMGLRMTAVIATFAGFPESQSVLRLGQAGHCSGSKQARAYRTRRARPRPPPILEQLFHFPDSCVLGRDLRD